MKNSGKLLIAIVLALAATQAWGGVTQGGDPNANGPDDSSDTCGCGGSS
jgi:hypothetical protein